MPVRDAMQQALANADTLADGAERAGVGDGSEDQDEGDCEELLHDGTPFQLIKHIANENTNMTVIKIASAYKMCREHPGIVYIPNLSRTSLVVHP